MSGSKPDHSNSHSFTPSPSRSSFDASSPTGAHPSLRMARTPSAAAQHRQSINELRGAPPSPRTQRQPSVTQIAVQELIDNPPQRSAPDPRFAGRDWRTIRVQELTSPDELRFVDAKTTVEAATNLLIGSGAPVVLIREDDSSPVISTFDYRDLTAYLLMVVGLAAPDDDHIQDFIQLAQKAREGTSVPLRDIKAWGKREPLTFVSGKADLIKAIELFGQAVQRIVVIDEETKAVTGLLSQSRLIRFLWENGRHFPVIDQLYGQYLRDLKIGSNNVISIHGDRPLAEALTLLHHEGVSSLPVLDNASNVLGNISVADVKLLTKSSSLPLLRNTCAHFISVILSARGLDEGKDSVPVFHVTPMNTLAHTVAKLVATKSHRVWVTESMTPSSSGPPTPSLPSATLSLPSAHNSSISPGPSHHYIAPPPIFVADSGGVADSLLKSPFSPTAGPLISASSFPGQRLSGKLVGVVSLTDILILFARAGGLHAADPNEVRMSRRRSSSSSMRLSVDLGPRPSYPTKVRDVVVFRGKRCNSTSIFQPHRRTDLIVHAKRNALLLGSTPQDGLKGLLQDSLDRREAFSNELKELKDLGQDLGHLTSDLRSIASGYTSTVKAAEGLTHRDWSDLMHGVRIYERKYLEEQAKLEAANKLIQEKEDFIKDLQKATRELVHFLGTFIIENIDEPPEDVMQIFADYPCPDYEWAIPYVRLPEASYNNMRRRYGDAQAGLEEYRAVAADQDSLIKEQSDQLMKQSRKYETSLLTLKEKNDEMTALEQKCATLEARLAEYEDAVGQQSGDGTPVHGEDFQNYIASLKAQADTLADGVASRDAQIESLLSQLRQRGRSWRSPAIRARTESVDFSSLSSSTARLGPLEPQGGDESKPKRSNSTSAAFLRGKFSNHTPSVQHRRRSLSFASSAHPQDGSEQPNDPFHSAQPRSDSLGPFRALRSEHATPSTVRGMLSDIPETSAEGGESPRALSTTSSDREVYRRSMSALNALNMFASMSTTNTSSAGAEPTNDNDPEVDKLSIEETEPLTVSEMYHEDTHHLTS
ncbi:hypothetical protein DV738_g788, partial [Chaetothyriales sp. CBS 135597]